MDRIGNRPHGPRWSSPRNQADMPVVALVSPNAGRLAGGLAVTITGTTFYHDPTGAAPVVTFDGVPATSVVVVSSTTLTCVTPVGVDVGLVDVTVTCGTQRGTLYGGFTYYTGVVSAVTPAYGVLAGGTTVLIQGYNFLDGSTVTFGGNAATNVIFIDSEHIKATTPNHAVGHVDVEVIEPVTLFPATLRGAFQYTLLTRGNDIRRQPGITIRDVLHSAPNECSFTVDGTSNAPSLGEKIEIIDEQDGDRLLFAGTIQRSELVYEDQTTQLAWNVSCVDFSWLANRRRPFGSYTNVSASDVLRDLVARYATGFTAAHVQSKLAKITISLNGEKTLAEVFDDIASAIGGGHWKWDYDQDLHFFHSVPPNFAPPPSLMPTLTDHMTIAEGTEIPSTFSFSLGVLMLRHTFVYSDGSESSYQAISNLLRVSGINTLSITGLPLGTNKGTLTCVARRIYYNLFKPNTGGYTRIEDVKQFAQVDDNVTTAFTCWFGTTGASNAAVIDIPANTSLPTKAYNGHPVGPVHAPTAVPTFGSTTSTPNTQMTNGWWQFKYAYLYRDGSVSFVSPASGSVGLKNLISGTGIQYFTMSGIETGASINGLDVVGRFVYWCMGLLTDPNYSIDRALVLGEVWPIPFLEPSWSNDTSYGLMIVPDNVSTTLPAFLMKDMGVTKSLARVVADLQASKTAGTLVALWGPLIGSAAATLQALVGPVPSTFDGLSAIVGVLTLNNLMNVNAELGLVVGAGNKPYNNGNILSSDPVPVWPNEDGPSLEDDDPPDDVTDDNPDLLHDEAGQALTRAEDIGQIRNRILVFGSGSMSTETAVIGATAILVADITSFSPAGGTVQVFEAATNRRFNVNYNGVAGVPGSASIVLSAALTTAIAQGAIITNFFQADDVESQKWCAERELDKDGKKTDGIHEFTIVDSSLKALFQLYMRAYAELELFAWPIVTVQYSTRDPKSKAGQTVHIDVENPPCFGDFLIQEVAIDQIHDESDDLMPRYTVTASSVRFDLNDFLLKILQPGNGSGTSAAGLVQAAITNAATGVGMPLPYTRKVAWAGLTNDSSFGTATTPSLHQIGMAGNPGVAVSGGGTQTGVTDTTGLWYRMTAPVNDGTEARTGYPNGATWCYAEMNPLVVIKMRTGNNIANMRMFFALVTALMGNADTNSSLVTGCGIKYSSALGGGWVGFTASGVSAYTAVTPTIAGIAASTQYILKISASPTTVVFDVNGSTQSLALPTALLTTPFISFFRLFNTESAVTKRFDWKQWYLEFD